MAQDITIYDASLVAGLTPRMIRFAELFVSSGGKREEAARAAGYSDKGDGAHVAANRLIHDPRVLKLVRHLCEAKVQGLIAQATAKLEHLMEHGSKNDAVKLKACQELLNRAGWLVASYSEVHHVVEHTRAGPLAMRLVNNLQRFAPEMGFTLTDPAKLVAFVKRATAADSLLGRNGEPAIEASYTEVATGDGEEDFSHVKPEDVL
ncbi:MAG: terminase small subunit [Alphaproteobacteria bacterium]